LRQKCAEQPLCRENVPSGAALATPRPHRYAIRRSLTACLGQFGIVKASSPSIQLVRVYRCSV
jgi:hypothetical protein